MEGLGRVFNVVPIAAGADLYVGECSAVTYVCTGSDTFTVQEHQSNGGAGQDLDVVTYWYTTTSTAGAAAWTKSATQTADAAVVSGGAVAIAITIHTTSLSDGYDYLSCTPSGSGLVTAILHDLTVQRDPTNLRVLAA
jgi:hypothetical protein